MPDRRAFSASRARLMYASTQIFNCHRPDSPGRIQDRFRGSHQKNALPFGMALLDDFIGHRESREVSATTGEPAVRSQQLTDITCDLHVRGSEHDQVVAHPFKVRDEM